MEDPDYFDEKPSRVRFSHKRRKHGSSARCGATLRRCDYEETRKSHDKGLILKHIRTAEGWDAQDVQDNLELEDGALSLHGWHKGTNARGKSARSVVAQHPFQGGERGRLKSSNVVYSINKKKRWLLRDSLKNEIERERVCRDGSWNTDIDLTLVERETVNQSFQMKNYPDATGVASTTLPEKDIFPKTKKRKSKRKRFGWSTDLLGLSQKPEQNDDQENQDPVFKPEVVYEICNPRTTGPFTHWHNLDRWYGKDEHKNRRRRQKMLDYDVKTSSVSLPASQNDEIETDVTSDAERTPLSIMTWIDQAENGQSTHHHQKTESASSAVRVPSPKKGRAIFMPQIAEEMRNNRLNSEDSSAADCYFENVLQQEKNSSVITKLSLQSLHDINNNLCRHDGNTATIQGVTVVKSKSRPVKYSFQMENQISVKMPNDELKTALSYFILEPLCDPGKCSNKEHCFRYNDFCVCNRYVPVRIKVVILSEEETHQECATAWADNVRAIFTKQKPDCPGFYLNKVISILKNTFESTVSVKDPAKDKKSDKKILILQKTVARKRKVVDKVSSLLGFAVKLVEKENVLTQTESHENPIITNHAPRDFCEICWTTLSDTGEDYDATSLKQCSHWFCYDCWRRHLSTITRSSATQPLQCPGHECDVSVDDVTLMSLLPGNILSQFQSRLLKNTVKRSENFHHCPQCSKTVEVSNKKFAKMLKKPTPLSCSCGARWCSKCKEEPHWPAACSEAEAYWKEIPAYKRKELVTTVSGRKCPACYEPIEKNGGCQMVYCICGHQFCWKCMQTFDKCLYRCLAGAPNLDTWDIESNSSSFAQGIIDAQAESQHYQSLKAHRKRLAACQNRATKVASIFADPKATRHQITAMKKELESYLQNVLLHCDALHHIIQYLIIAIVTKKRNRRSPHAKLNRFLLRIQVALGNIEQSIFEEKAVSKVELEQRIEKKIAYSTSLLNYLVVYANQLL